MLSDDFRNYLRDKAIGKERKTHNPSQGGDKATKKTHANLKKRSVNKKPTFRSLYGVKKKLTGKRRKPSRLSFGSKNRIIIQKTVITAGFFILLVAAVLFLNYLLTNKNATEVFVNGKSVGTIKDKSVTSDDLIELVTKKIESKEGAIIRLETAITTEPVHAGSDVVTNDALITEIMKNASYKVSGYSISVDDVSIGALKTKEEADSVLNAILSKYSDDETPIDAEITFVEKVECESSFVSEDQFVSPESITDKLSETTSTTEIYTAVKGDVYSKVWGKAGMSQEEFLAANPRLDLSSTLRIGQELNITKHVPFVSVKSVEKKTHSEVVKYGVQEIENPSLSRGSNKVIQQGADGMKEITTQIVRINGEIEEEEQIDEKYVKDPVDQIVEKGTR